MLKIKLGWLYIIVILISFLSLYAIQFFILDTADVKEAYSYVLTERMLATSSFSKLPVWLILVLTIITVSIRIFATLICVLIGYFLNGVRNVTSKVFKVITLSQFVFVAQYIAELIWFKVSNVELTVDVVEGYNPFALSFLVYGISKTEWSYIILNQINFFDVIYIVVLAILLGSVRSCNFGDRFVFIFKTYGLGFLIFVLLNFFFLL